MPTRRPGPPPHPSRRAALGLGAGALAAITVSACGIRLEDDAPHVPGVPRRTPVAGEAFLIALWRHTDDLATRAASVGGPATGVPARLAALHRVQARTLRAELGGLGVPEPVLADAERPTTGTTGTASTTPSPSSPTTAARTRPVELGAAEAGDLGPTAISSLARIPVAAVPLVGAVLAQRAAAATLLGAPATWPEQPWKEPSLAASYLASTRAAVYAFQVVAAQSPDGAQHTMALGTLAALQTRAATQESMAAGAAGPPPLAYPLPFPVTTPAAARRLAADVLGKLLEAVARDLGSAGKDVAALGMLVQWLGETEVLASRWGLRLAPFPGLS